MIQVASHSPTSIDELLSRAEQIAGLTLGELAQIANIRIPKDFKREKGWTGQLLELFLGAHAGSTKTQDFPDLGVELKTIPIDQQLKPLETTYVCYAPLTNVAGVSWEQSNVRNKLNCVMWIPVEGDRNIPVAMRRLAMPVLWQPSDAQLALLRQDWEELMDMIVLGDIENITARHGQALHMRPKAANGKALTDAIGKHGQLTKTRPRGFYLRTSFTGQILQDYFCN